MLPIFSNPCSLLLYFLTTAFPLKVKLKPRKQKQIQRKRLHQPTGKNTKESQTRIIHKIFEANFSFHVK